MVALIFINYIFVAFIGGAVVFIGKGGLAVGRLFKIAVTFIGKGSLVTKGRSFETTGAKVINDIEGVDECNLRQ